MHTSVSKKLNNGKRVGSEDMSLSQFDMMLTQVGYLLYL